MELAGTSVSRGVAVGKAVCLFGEKLQFFRVDIAGHDLQTEIDRFRAALNAAKYQLNQLTNVSGDLPPSASGIFDVHLMILEHSSFAEGVENYLAVHLVNAEWALKTVSDEHVSRQSSVTDQGIGERYIDVQDVAERVMNALDGSDNSTDFLTENAVVIASMVRPSTLVELSRHRPLAIVTEYGGWTSHAFIMAREMRIPAVTGIADIFRVIADGDLLLVDGYNGKIILRPSADRVSKSENVRDPVQDEILIPPGHLEDPRTLDGHAIVIRANAENIESAAELHLQGARGIGLLRSEYLFGQRIGSFPTGDEQTRAYSSIAKLVGENGLRIRTFDVNADQLSFSGSGRERNPSLGLRAIRLSFADEENFRTQIRSILRASAGNNVDIVLPMISGLYEIYRAKNVIENEKTSLRQAGVEAGDPRVGVMIEVPSAVLMIDEIVKNVDFVCLGTNDLVQYLLAVDRDNGSVADWYQTLHPAVLRSIKTVIRAADMADIPAVMCGEMAGSPFYTPLLIGLGAREFSMNLNAIAAVRNVIAGISFEEAFDLAGQVAAASTASDVEAKLRQFYMEKWPHLFESNLRIS